jgi:excisionase family DNA binding protein
VQDIQPSGNQLLFSVDQACAALSLSRPVLYRIMRAGNLPYLHFGAARRIERSALEALLERARRGEDVLGEPGRPRRRRGGRPAQGAAQRAAG